VISSSAEGDAIKSSFVDAIHSGSAADTKKACGHWPAHHLAGRCIQDMWNHAPVT